MDILKAKFHNRFNIYAKPNNNQDLDYNARLQPKQQYLHHRIGTRLQLHYQMAY